MAGVSITTVSKIINNKAQDISPQTKKKVFDLIDEMHYTPNAAARSLVTKRTRLLGLLLPDISNPYFSDMARGAEDAAHTHGYNLVFCNSDDDVKKEREYVGILLEKAVEGIIIVPGATSGESIFDSIIKLRVPFVVLDRVPTDLDENIHKVYFDNVRGGYLATKYLIEHGHRSIGCITGPSKNKSAIDRLCGYKIALAEFGIAINNDIIAEGNYRYGSGIEAASSLIEKGVRALFIQNDTMSFGAYAAAQTAGLSIPGDISIIGYDDIGTASILTPPMTTIKQPGIEMGGTSCKMLIDIIEKKGTSKSVKFEPSIVERRSVSVACPPGCADTH